MKNLAAIIANPASGGFQKRTLARAADALEARGIRATVHLTSPSRNATAIAHDAAHAHEKPRFVLVIGGDGTINEAINGLIGTGVPLAVLPTGTANVLALELGLPRAAGEAVDRAVSGLPRGIALGRVRTNKGSRYFFMSAGIGFDAATVFGLNKRLKRLAGRAAYVESAIRTLARWSAPQPYPQPYPQLYIEAGDESLSCSTVIACNTSRYAGNFILARGAEIAEPVLHVLAFRGGRRRDVLRYGLSLISGGTAGLPDVRYFKTERMFVRGRAHIQVDGEYFAEFDGEAEITSHADAVRVIY